MKFVEFLNSPEKTTVGKIVCVGRNYAEHAKELGNEVPEFPVLFLKPASALIYSGDTIIKPAFSNEMHHEIELVLLVGRDLKDASEEESLAAITAYSIGLDMTLRDVQNVLKKKGEPWTIAKCFDTSAVISKLIKISENPLSPEMNLSLSVNGNLRQSSKLENMIFSPSRLISYISSRMMLEPGDLIYTGTPAGVNKVEPGDILVGKLDELISLEAKVG
ncbi:MAG: fumarylacetoacetate hydrolase family protein [Ignavibacteriaceae bacterium]|nr:fumarylacetoacetate hydrolase family protein [Ignavibacteriaceae bacterium]